MNDLRQAAEMALKALEDIFGKEKVDVGAINALRQALTPEVTPEVTPDVDNAYTKLDTKAGVLHKEWVGLTKEEFERAVDGLEDLEDCWVQIEARLKEKNT
jgi:hypothetical protein